MKLFGKKTTNSSCCSTNYTTAAMQNAEASKNTHGFKILGSGCAKCKALENAVHTAVTESSMVINIEHITDFAQIASYGVMSTPALVLDGKVVSYGKVLTVEEVKQIINKMEK